MTDKQLDPLKGERKEDILARKDVQDSIRLGVSPDDLNYKKLFGYTLLGIIIVGALLILALNMFRYTAFQKSQEAAINAEFYELDALRSRHADQLNSFTIIDEQSGKYAVPVDSAITLIVEDYN